MSSKIRLDKYLADMSFGTRTEVKQMIKKGLISVNGTIIKRPEIKVEHTDQVVVSGKEVIYHEFEYFMLNKPAGVVSATEDNLHKTVIELIDSNRKDLFPVGRLDIDTEGLLLITNDGELAHELLSPKKHISKTYYAIIDGDVTEKEVQAFQQGLDLGDFTSKPAELTVLSTKEIPKPESEIEVTIYEGKFHQVKRMFEAVGMRVTYLKRISMGELQLDPSLELGTARPLSKEEVEQLKKKK